MNPSRNPRTCTSCRKPKTIASFGRGETRCRLCIRNGVEIHADTPLDATGKPKRGRLCAACAVERPAYQFDKRGGVTAQCCDLCTSDPGIRVTLRQVDVATVVVRSLRQIAAARHDCADGPLTLGVEAMREIARVALMKDRGGDMRCDTFAARLDRHDRRRIRSSDDPHAADPYPLHLSMVERADILRMRPFSELEITPLW